MIIYEVQQILSDKNYLKAKINKYFSFCAASSKCGAYSAHIDCSIDIDYIFYCPSSPTLCTFLLFCKKIFQQETIIKNTKIKA